MSDSYPFDPDYTLVSKADLANVLTVYEEHVPEDVRPFCPWYLRCKEALDDLRPRCGVPRVRERAVRSRG